LLLCIRSYDHRTCTPDLNIGSCNHALSPSLSLYIAS
jgi:hypothetical protein